MAGNAPAAPKQGPEKPLPPVEVGNEVEQKIEAAQDKLPGTPQEMTDQYKKDGDKHAASAKNQLAVLESVKVNKLG